jgi:hypothetical protein
VDDYVIMLIGLAAGLVLLALLVTTLVLPALRRFTRARTAASATVTARVGLLTDTVNSRRLRDEHP